jgi:hypothetical protein
MVADFTLDGGGVDSQLIVKLLGSTTSPPTTVLFTDTLVADSTGWDEFTWTGLDEDTTYYWRVVATDADCADTTATWSFTVDSIPPVTADSAATIRGGYYKGIKIGDIEDGESRREETGAGHPAVPADLPAARGRVGAMR